jgi:hypothetical protein
MKKVFLTFAFVLVTLQLHPASGQVTKISTLELWSDNDQDASAKLHVDGSTEASVYHVPGIIYFPQYWKVESSAYASAVAQSAGDELQVGASWHC